MKSKILFLLVLLFTGFSQAQTGVIALKSHSGQLAELSNKGDNFGDPPMNVPKYYLENKDTMTYLGNNCVQIKSIFSCDTLCNDPLFKEFNYNPELLKNELAPGTVFKDFEKYKDESSLKSINSRRSKSAIPWLVTIFSMLTFGFLFYKKSFINTSKS